MDQPERMEKFVLHHVEDAKARVLLHKAVQRALKLHGLLEATTWRR